jgi:hypothetical protein
VAVPLINDTLRELPETILLQITNPGGGVSLGARDTAVLTLTDNDVAGADYVLGNRTVTFGANQTTQTVVLTLAADDAIAEGNKTVNVTLSNPGGGATLGARTSAMLKILDNEATVQLAAPTYAAAEGAAAGLLIERTGTAGTVIVRYATSDGTGVAGVDYRPTVGTLTFNAGVASLTATVPTIANTVQEGPRTFTVTLTVLGGTAGAVLGPRSSALVTIVDNDIAGTLAFSSTTYKSSEFGTIPLSIRRPANANAGPATVAYTTVDGTARAGLDYQMTSGVVTFRPGVFDITILVPVFSNNRDDGDRSFTVQLSSPTGGATLGTPSVATVLISDNDSGGVVQFSSLVYTVSECPMLPCTAALTVQRIGGGASGVTVDFATIDGTATALNDYVATTGQVSLASGQMSTVLRIPLQIELGAQPLKTFSVILTNPRGGATLGAQTTTEVRITDTR